jgi:hypothetical protein
MVDGSCRSADGWRWLMDLGIVTQNALVALQRQTGQLLGGKYFNSPGLFCLADYLENFRSWPSFGHGMAT